MDKRDGAMDKRDGAILSTLGHRHWDTGTVPLSQRADRAGTQGRFLCPTGTQGRFLCPSGRSVDKRDGAILSTLLQSMKAVV